MISKIFTITPCYKKNFWNRNFDFFFVISGKNKIINTLPRRLLNGCNYSIRIFNIKKKNNSAVEPGTNVFSLQIEASIIHENGESEKQITFPQIGFSKLPF